jgi:hypothetical protein
VMLQDADFSGPGLPAGLIVEMAERCPNLRFAKLENPLAGEKCAEIIHLSNGRVEVLYGMSGVALLDGLDHGATGVMPGSAFVESYATVIQLYDMGGRRKAQTLFHRMLPYISFAIQHLELLIQMEKRGLVRRRIFSSAKMREPTLCLDDAYQKHIDELIDGMLTTCVSTKTDSVENFL